MHFVVSLCLKKKEEKRKASSQCWKLRRRLPLLFFTPLRFAESHPEKSALCFYLFSFSPARWEGNGKKEEKTFILYASSKRGIKDDGRRRNSLRLPHSSPPPPRLLLIPSEMGNRRRRKCPSHHFTVDFWQDLFIFYLIIEQFIPDVEISKDEASVLPLSWDKGGVFFSLRKNDISLSTYCVHVGSMSVHKTD